MAFRIEVADDCLTVWLSGWDRLMNGRRRLRFESSAVRRVSVDARGPLEDEVEHRALGVGTHDGAKRPGRRRVGSMIGRAVVGRQFWAVGAGPPSTRLLVLDLGLPPFARAVLEVDDVDAVAARLTATAGRS
ncbi:MAG: hypothetical protein KDB21_05420 [Acidimicrobiales bacterium]|nr:hypothetical protein [Acidimicrobiales bacterium]